MSFKLAIVGAGPAGCTLARLLLQSDKGISVTIFESESGLNFRSQGGTLDLHETTGQAALKAAGLFDEFLKYARYDGEAMKICDKKLLCYIKQEASKKGSFTGRPEIDRPELRKLLFNSLPHGTVQWEKKLLRVDSDRVLHFTDGASQSGFDLIVGGDGAWSKVRPLLSDAQPYYSGIAGHALSIADVETRHPEIYDLVNRGSLFAFSDGKSIMAQYMGEGSISIGTWSLHPKNWQDASGYDVHDASAVKAAMRKDYADWDPRLLDITQQADDSVVVARDLYMLPIGHSWKHVEGVTLIGDAAHLMTPFAGEGVNVAMADSMKLASAIISATSLDDLDTKVAAFETEMFSRAGAVQQLTYDMLSAMYLTPGAPRQGIERYIIRAMSDEMGPWLTILLTPVVYTWFFLFKLIY